MASAVTASFPFAAALDVATLLRQAPLEALENRILVSHVLGLSRIQLITQSERIVSAAETARLNDVFQQRLDGEPIAYIVGEREFFGLPLQVSPAVLIPRPETELLVELALERLPPGASLLDMGTGSGAIAVAIAHQRPDAAVTALDVSAAALQIARANALRHAPGVSFLRSDWYAALNDAGHQRFAVIASNPPYIVAGDRHLAEGDLRFEPVDALTDHDDGLSALRIIIAGAADHLLPGGWLLLEHGYDQAAAVRALLDAHGFDAVQSWRDLASIERASGGHLKSAG